MLSLNSYLQSCSTRPLNITYPIKRILTRNPQVFAISMVWGSSRPPMEHLESLFNRIDPAIELKDVFAAANSARYSLKGVVCYYGLHYATFIWQKTENAWFMFDDSSVSTVCNRKTLLTCRLDLRGWLLSRSVSTATIFLACSFMKTCLLL